MSNALRFPAEWEPQSAVIMAWPHAGTDWAARLTSTAHCFAGIAAAISHQQPLLLLVPNGAVEMDARLALGQIHAHFANIQFLHMAYNDTWLRDSGPITLRDGDGFRVLDFVFTAWGGKFEAGQDDQIVANLVHSGIFRKIDHQRVAFALEGGGIETDGDGTLLSTWHCLHERHPDKTRLQIESALKTNLWQERVLWLEHGYLEGDDTDAHIDTLARFVSASAIVYQGCQNPADSHYHELQAMAAQLRALRQRNGQPYVLHELPWPEPILDGERRLAASYANFLIINGAVLLPSYGDDADAAAVAVLQAAFPERHIVPVPCRDIIWQNGSLHCCTMQLPQGLLK